MAQATPALETSLPSFSQAQAHSPTGTASSSSSSGQQHKMDGLSHIGNPHAADGTSKEKERITADERAGPEELPGSHTHTRSSRSKPSWSTRLHSSLGLNLGLSETLEHDSSTTPLAWMALLTGLVDGAVYSRAEIWTGFQTGNTVQVALGITTYIFPQAADAIPRAPLLLLLRSLSLLAFFLAGIVGARVGEKWGHRRRAYLVASSCVQSALLFGAAGILWTRPEGEELTYRYWPGVILLIAFSMGLQSIQAQKVASPVFSTSVAFTATMTQIAADPKLFSLSTAVPSPLDVFRRSGPGTADVNGDTEAEGTDKSTPPRRRRGRPFFGDKAVKGRDLRLLALVCLATGGGVAQSLLEGQTGIGLRGTMMVAAGCKGFLALLWLIPRGKKK